MKIKIKIFFSLVLFLFVSINYNLAGAEPKWYHGAEKLGDNQAEIIGKAPNCIIVRTNHGLRTRSNHIMVERSSRFYDIDGSFITLRTLKIPCLAEIRINNRSGIADPLLMDLKVIEYDDDASTAFTMKEPFKRLPR